MTPQFLSTLQFEDDGGFPFMLLRPLHYRTALDIPVSLIVVPAGFKTDLASIPRPLWSLLPPIGKYDAAAVVHDFLYQTGGVERGEADQILREAMEVVGVGWWSRWLIYSGVRTGGWAAWNSYRKNK